MRITAVVLLLLVVAVSAVSAAPSLPVTKPPVTSNPSWTGPTVDPHAVNGQWFSDGTYRTHEFYDNKVNDGGGTATKEIGGVLQDWGSTNAVYGKVESVTQTGGYITAFNITAVITNELPGIGEWADGANTPGEGLSTDDKYTGSLYSTRLTAEFAITDTNNLPSNWVSPYFDMQPYIVATNEDVSAWYGWTPGSNNTPNGGYYVPTWEFYDIEAGASSIRQLTFAVSGSGLAVNDARYDVIMQSYQAQWGLGDIFLNRTTDLKLGEWLDTVVADDGTAYPALPLRSGNVSVFNAVPEPGSLTAMAGGLLGFFGMIIRRRK